MPSSEPSSPHDLKFPPVQVDRSFTNVVDLEALMKRSTQRRAPEEAANSLEDSGYDLLSDSVMDMSDDEAHTASIASTDGPTPDESSDDFSDDDVEYDADERELQDSVYSSHADRSDEQANPRPVTAWEDSTLTEVPPYLTASESSWQITLEEQATDKTDTIEGCKIIKSSADYTDELPQVFSRYGCGEVRLSVKAALSHRPLPTPDSYRIMYIGMPEKWAEDITTVQIGTALGACPSVSKSVMVRGQIEPYAPVPQVDHGVKVDIAGPPEKPTHVLVTLEDGQQVKFGSDVTHSLNRPDLVVVCYRSFPDPATDGQDIASARKVFEAANIPCIDLAQVIPHGTASRPDDSTALRVRVEGRDDPDADYELKAVLPLDHRSFSRLDPYQLNRHLALISPHLMKAQDAEDDTKSRTSWIGGKVKTFKKKASPQGYLMRTLVSALVLCVLVPAFFHGAAFAPVLFQKGLQSISTVSVLPEILGNTSTSTPVVATPSVAVPPPITSSVPAVLRGGLLVVPAEPKQPKRILKSKDKNVAGFEIETTAEHQFILRPSTAFTSSRKRPQLQIQVSRQSQVVPVRYNRTVSGEYIVDLEQQYPLGTFNVSIATHSKPLLRQSFEVRLGYNMSTLEQFLDTVKSGIFKTQHTLLNVSGSTGQHMRAYMAGLDANVMAASEQFRNVQQTIQRHLELDARLAKKVPKAAWAGLREVTAPVRTSSSMKRARMNALRVRCKIEMATGLSAKDSEGKQSWACSKVQEEV
ncbi:hypothetical protein PTNB73_04972 [Pyrenophora teres f. teres]|uniref:Uncharacterized protein n=2 Tax=Pyrenophora teres f. teres TaxID=97479 RepID=E3S995_PYRTT|nr:hypothetical protein PTT_19592 [Pyrenophora teres f. teres 0-1]KAE8833645.1 hypothetical protein HRS9139_05464 [Pyrenophora teres f. teres]KAE8840588.1 hypothetical protein PTNB85_03987 [Pyrenophora teres f. teres]KAE8849273.1 hypothetical protein HRS9122_03289 [Pyrenophora teres f. teres]KAE8864082.1 hypothetical protein PTNB29_04046 [Pyrenophora teres f. teres]